MAGAMLIPALAQAATPGATQITLLIGELFDTPTAPCSGSGTHACHRLDRLIITSDEGSMDKAKSH